MNIIKKHKLVLVMSLLGAVAATPIMADTSPSNRSFGKNHPFEIKDLPPSALTEGLKNLSASDRGKAKSWLNKMQFHSRDVPYLRVDKNGAIFYADPSVPYAVLNQYRRGSSLRLLPGGTDVFKLHSKLGATNVVYLDFNGELITNTAWNEYSAKPILTAKAYDIDGSSGGFNDTEQANLAEIWRRVAEDYAPFDVDITTELPASFGATTAHAVITTNVDANGLDMPSKSSGGVSYVNVWGMSNYASYLSPAFIYYNQVGGADNIAEAVSHEIGHNLGLAHDGTSTTSYYRGQGSGLISWAPIMGSSYYNEVTQWSAGEYPDANQTQDDLAIIGTKLRSRADDHGNTFASASALVINSNGSLSSTTPLTNPSDYSPINKGIINSRSDVDYFKFLTSGGTVSLQANPLWELNAQRGGDLDIQLSLYDSLGNLILSSNPSDDTTASLLTSLAAGTYYLAVDGVGSANYSDYGSIGQYFMAGAIPTAVDTTPPSPNPLGWSLAPSASSRTSVHMTAVTASDSSGGVEYYFACVSGGLGCVDSGWLKSPDYNLSGLSPSTAYGFTVKARDGANNETTKTAVATLVTLSNSAPVATADNANGLANSTVVINALANDRDPNGDALNITRVSQSTQKGLITFDNSSITYKPLIGFVGTDSFTYTISDSYGATATASITVIISSPVATSNRPPVALADTAKIYTQTTVTIPVLANDKDPDGNSLSITAVGTSIRGSTIINNGSSLIYKAGTRTGKDTFSYTISDGKGGTATATVSVSLVMK